MDFAEYLNHSSISLLGGGNYGRYLEGNFYPATEKFIKSLAYLQYDTNYPMFHMKRNRLKAIFTRFVNKALRVLHFPNKIRIPEDKLYFFNAPSKERFLQLSHDMFDDIFGPFMERNNASHVVLDQACFPGDVKTDKSFLRDSKSIIVDRDPRDRYADEIICNGDRGFGKDWAIHRDASRYLEVHNAARGYLKNFENDGTILFLRFEDLVLHYEETLKRIMDFAGLKPEDHIRKRKFFNPDVSAKNVGLWKKVLSDTEAKTIASELADYCYKMD